MSEYLARTVGVLIVVLGIIFITLLNIERNLATIATDLHAMSAATVEAAEVRARVSGQAEGFMREWMSMRFDTIGYKPFKKGE